MNPIFRLSILSVLAVLFLFPGCAKEVAGPSGGTNTGGGGNTGGTANGNVSIRVPVAGMSYASDTTITIQWTTGRIPASTPVTIELYRNDTLISSLVEGTSNDGLYSWYVGSYFAGTSNFYRIKITDYNDTSRYDYSNNFRLFSRYSGSYTVTSPTAGSILYLGTGNLTIQWTSTGSPGSTVRLQIVNDSASVYSITTSTSNDGYYSTSLSMGALPTGSRYRVKIISYYDAGVTGYSGYFTIQSGYSGGYAFTVPDTSAVWSAGTSYTAQWTTTGNPGSYINLELWRGGVRHSTLTTSSYNGNSYSVSLSSCLETGRYRLKLVSYSDPSISAFSDSFTIQGLLSDTYEPDNSRSTARSLTFGTAQLRSIACQDTDWVSFTPTAGTTYLIQSSGDFQTYNLLFRGARTSVKTSFYGGSSGSPYLTWTCDSSDTYLLQVRGRYSYEYGDYTLRIIAMDSLHLCTFSSPLSSSVWAAGSSYSLSWTIDTTLMSDYVRLQLCSDTVPLYSITSSTSSTAAYSWSPLSSLATGSRYRIKLSDYSNNQLYGFSDLFTISGIAADTFETDNLRSLARPITTDGIAQNRTIAYADTDWVKFAAKKDTQYVITANGTPYVYLYLYDSLGSYRAYDSYSNPQIVWSCTTAGTYYAKVYPYSSSYNGVYRLSVRSLPANLSGGFIEPARTTVWSTGGSYSIQWTPDTMIFSTAIRLSLYNGTRLMMSLASSTANDGLYAWTLPAGLATGSGYRLRLENTGDPRIGGYSDSFTVSGTPADAFERDDTLTQATVLTLPVLDQGHSITYLDRDWFSFTAQRNHIYRVRAEGATYPGIDLYNTDGLSILKQANNAHTDTAATLNWYCVTAGNYFVQVDGGSRTGAYWISMSEYDSAQFGFDVTSPSSVDTVSPGSVLSINWTDPSSLGDYVDIFLYNGNGIVETIISRTLNDGSYTWSLPVTLPVRNDYYVRVMSLINSNISGSGMPFTVR